MADNKSVYIGGWHRSAGGTVHQGSIWANPYELDGGVPRAQALERYRQALRARPDFPAGLYLLAGKKLLCHCPLDRPCHADVLIEEFGEHLASAPVPRAVVGVPWEPLAFVQAAQDACHPLNYIDVDGAVASGLAAALSTGVAATRARRDSTLDKWQRWATELADEEAELHRSLHPSVAQAMKGKRMLLLRRILRDLHIPGADRLFNLLKSGFPLVGPMEASGLFMGVDHSGSFLPESELVRRSAASRRACIAATKSSGDPLLDEALAAATAEEVEKGWLVGPFSEEDINSRFDGVWTPARRFGVVQGGKVRPIDDYSAFGHNAATSIPERIDMGGVDHLASIARAAGQCVAAGHLESLRSQSGAGAPLCTRISRVAVAVVW